MNKEKLYINGQWIKPNSSELIEVENPANKKIIGHAPASNEEDVNRAVKAAKDALEDWKECPVEKRISYVEKMLEYLEDKTDKIVDTVIDELGSVVSQSKDLHVSSYIENSYDYIRIARDMDFVEDHDGYKIFKEPVGVVACLTPWNFPFGQISKKLIPALLMGNTVVLKPSQKTPLTAYYFAEAADYAELPAGVFQLVPGRGSEVGNVLARHPDVNMLSFTGSTKGGKEVASIGLSTSVKRLALELGGKSASLILPGADYRKAVEKTLSAVYPNAGQACSSKTRMLVPRKDRKEIEELVVEISKTYKCGDPRDPESDFGPLQSQKAYDKVKGYVDLGKEEAELLYEGSCPDLPGYYMPAYVFTDVDNKSRLAQEEIFGPVESIIFYDSIEEAIELANDSIYGLHGLVFAEDDDKAMEVAKKIKAGQLQINSGSRTHNAPFGGYKQSGLGREGGVYGMEEYMEIKTVFY